MKMIRRIIPLINMKLIVMTLMRQYFRLDDIACLENGGF